MDRRGGRPPSMLVLDVDRFKGINDRFGHKVGDEVPIAVGRTIRRRLRETDHLARHGGAEFAAIAPYTKPDATNLLGERMRAAIERDAHQSLDGLSENCRVGEVSA